MMHSQQDRPTAERLPRAEPLAAARNRSPLYAGLLVIATLVALGVLSGVGDHTRSGWERWFDLDQEGTVPAAFSALLLLLAAGAALRSPFRAELAPVGVFFAVMALDEALSVHERVERWTGVDWQLVYAPVFVFAVVSWFRAASRMGADPRRDWVLGAGFWAVAMVLEFLQWGPAIGVRETLVIFEEAAEMIGSLMFLCAVIEHRTSLDDRDEGRTIGT